MAHRNQSKPVINPSRQRSRTTVEPTATFVASLARPAPLTLLCMACRTPRCADTNRIVLWHPDGAQPSFECAGAGAPGLDLP